MAEPLNLTQLLNLPAAYGDIFEDVSRPAHTTQRFKFLGRRGETGTVRALSLHVDKATADAFYAGLEITAGFEVNLTATFNYDTWTGVLSRPKLIRSQAIGSSNPLLYNWLLEVEFNFTRTTTFGG